jgi:diaminopimelate decarboxylase
MEPARECIHSEVILPHGEVRLPEPAVTTHQSPMRLFVARILLTEDLHPPILALRELTDDGPADYENVALAGPTCDSADMIARDYPMPPLGVGDIVVSPMMGAYTAVTSSRFNGIPATPIVMS